MYASCNTIETSANDHTVVNTDSDTHSQEATEAKGKQLKSTMPFQKIVINN